jgi:hypothetical protein
MDRSAETERLKTIAQQTRLKTIQTELTLAFTWCSVARTEVEMGECDRFQTSLQRIKYAAESLRRRIADPAHVKPALTPELKIELERLYRKIKDLEFGFVG